MNCSLTRVHLFSVTDRTKEWPTILILLLEHRQVCTSMIRYLIPVMKAKAEQTTGNPNLTYLVYSYLLGCSYTQDELRCSFWHWLHSE